ncbi:MAG TPA: response regulator [Candidatus Omnitrophota bacterium]|nr:response regulator [Candidatus Omnitrophota bacterium]
MPKTILVVDDEPDILKILLFRLNKLGYDVITATNGIEAIDAVRDNMPDLILLDLMIPVLDGVEVAKRLKSDQDTKDIPIIVVTASTHKVAEKAKECQAADYITKPFVLDELVDKIKKLIE